MTTKEIVEHFGSVLKAARALGLSTQAIYQWGERPPMSQQYRVQVLTLGELVADKEALL